MARDQGADPLYSYCTVYINVSDINDEPPRFREKHVTISLSDGAFGYVYNMTAVDLDLDYQLKYFILWNESYGLSASLTMITGDQLSVIIISTAAAASSTLLSISLIFIWLFILFTVYTNSPRRILNCLKIICRMILMLSWTNFTEILLSFFLHFLELARYRLWVRYGIHKKAYQQQSGEKVCRDIASTRSQRLQSNTSARHRCGILLLKMLFSHFLSYFLRLSLLLIVIWTSIPWD